MIRHALALSLAVGLLHDPSCGGSDEGAASGVNAPCTRDRDCKERLRCAQGVCEPQDAAPPDAAQADAGNG